MGLNTCCCCISLRTGAIIIGILSAVTLIAILDFLAFRIEFLFQISYVGFCLLLGSAIVIIATNNGYAENVVVFYVIFVCALFVAIIGLVVSSLLIYGAAKERKGFVLPWIIYQGIFLVLYVIGIIIMAILAQEAVYAVSVISLGE